MMDDVDRAAVAFGQATRIAHPERPSIIYEQRCDFCKRVHRSEFFDEVEETILRCRDAAPDWLADYIPVTLGEVFQVDNITIRVIP